MDAATRDRLRAAYAAGRLLDASGAAVAAQEPSAWMTAWNPLSRPLPEAANHARDALLAAELAALGLIALRAAACAPDGSWREEGWLFPHDAARTRRLLSRYGQHAAYVLDGGSRRLCWQDGLEEPA